MLETHRLQAGPDLNQTCSTMLDDDCGDGDGGEWWWADDGDGDVDGDCGDGDGHHCCSATARTMCDDTPCAPG